MIEPLELQFTVACSAAHAFRLWTSKTAMWWPLDHTVTEEKELEIVIEGRVGGRIFERTRSGVEHAWGEVLAWDPPRALTYRWHLGADRADATEVSVTFTDRGEHGAEIRIEHRGWERLGSRAAERREGNKRGWVGVLPLFVDACASIPA